MTERMRALSAQLIQAIEADQEELVGTLLAERQQLIKTLGAARIGPEDHQALRESDLELCRLAQQVRDQLAQQLQTGQHLQRLQSQQVLSHTAPASFLDQFG